MGWRGGTNHGKICWFIYLAPAELVFLTVSFGLIPILIVIVLYCIILRRAIKKVNQLRRATSGEEDPKRGLRVFRGGSTADNIYRSNEEKKGKFGWICCSSRFYNTEGEFCNVTSVYSFAENPMINLPTLLQSHSKNPQNGKQSKSYFSQPAVLQSHGSHTLSQVLCLCTVILNRLLICVKI